MSGILVAGIGNIFKGDDGFGVEVAQRLTRRAWPAGVKVVDFGIRGLDLTYALLDGYDAAVLVDTVQRGEPPGTLYVIEPERSGAEAPNPGDLEFSPHELDPAKVLRLVQALGGDCPRVVVLACEPLTFGDEEDAMGLSAPTAAAVEPAIAMIEDLVGRLLGELAPRRGECSVAADR
jgi:hydrogenase maturation protease